MQDFRLSVCINLVPLLATLRLHVYTRTFYVTNQPRLTASTFHLRALCATVQMTVLLILLAFRIVEYQRETYFPTFLPAQLPASVFRFYTPLLSKKVTPRLLGRSGLEGQHCCSKVR